MRILCVAYEIRLWSGYNNIKIGAIAFYICLIFHWTLSWKFLMFVQDLRIRFPLTPNCGLLDLIRPRPSNLRAATHFYCSIKKGNANILFLFNCSQKLYGNANILFLFNCSQKLYGHVAYTWSKLRLSTTNWRNFQL